MPPLPSLSRDRRPDSWTHGAIADMFSSYVTASALSAAQELGILDALNDTGEFLLDGDQVGDIDAGVTDMLCTALAWADVVEVQDGAVVPGPRFAPAYAARGYFYWLVRGCGELFASAPGVARPMQRIGQYFQRDMRAVAIGSRLIGDEQVEPLFDEMLARFSFRRVADLGCGSGERLLRIAGNHQGVTCVGVDISAAATKLAVESVHLAGLDQRIDIELGDVCGLQSSPKLADVDLLTCVFMGHDFWPYASCVKTLRSLHVAFPSAQRFLLCDVVRSEDDPAAGTPIFRLGFETVHALMGVYLPTYDEWLTAFAAAGWTLQSVRGVEAPPNGYLFELTPAD